LYLVYQDIVAQSLKVTLTVNTGSNADADAKLSGALQGKVGSVIGGSGTELSIKVDSAAAGKYVLDVASPVILATWTKQQPDKGRLGDVGIPSWADSSVPKDRVFTVKP
jgi:hypothetical protein